MHAAHSKHAPQQMFMEMVSSIRQHGVTAPIYVSVWHDVINCALRKRYMSATRIG